MWIEMILELGVSFALIARVCILWGIVSAALERYYVTHLETIGFAMAITSVALASGVLLFSLYQILKSKPLETRTRDRMAVGLVYLRQEQTPES